MINPLPCILIVDDDEDNTIVMSHLIKKENLATTVAVAIDGEAALQYLQNNPPPSLILLDINMPRMNGWEFLEEYYKLPSKVQQSVVVVMLTVSLNPDDRKRASEQDLDFVNKPLTADLLRDLIQTHFS